MNLFQAQKDMLSQEKPHCQNAADFDPSGFAEQLAAVSAKSPSAGKRVCVCCSARLTPEGQESLCPTCASSETLKHTCRECGRLFYTGDPFDTHCSRCSSESAHLGRELSDYIENNP